MTRRDGHIIVVGDIVTDVVAMLGRHLAPDSDTPARISVRGGGQAANTAAWLAWLGAGVTLVAAVGTDPAGDERLAELTSAGVRCAVSRHAGVPTGTVIVLVGAGQRTMVTDRGANLLISPADVESALDLAPDAGHLHLSGYVLLDPASRPAGRHALRGARERGMSTSVDAASTRPLRQAGPVAFLEWTRGVDLLLANRDEAAVLAGAGTPEQQARALAATAASAVVKLGGHGAVWVGRGEPVRCPGSPSPQVDPTGAGDAFAAALLAAWTAGADRREALAAGARAGAAAVAAIGARPPSPAERARGPQPRGS